MQPTGESGRTGLPPPGAQRLPLSQPSGGTQRGIARRRSTWRRSSARPAKSRPRLVTSRAAARAGAWCCSSPACQSQANVMKREASKAAASMRKPQGPRLGRGSRGVGVPVHGNRPTVQASRRLTLRVSPCMVHPAPGPRVGTGGSSLAVHLHVRVGNSWSVLLGIPYNYNNNNNG